MKDSIRTVKKVTNNITVLVDIDDTIEYLSKAWVKALNNEYGTNVDYKKIRGWNISKYFPSLSEEQVFEPLHRDHFWLTVEPMQDAIMYLQKMIIDGFDVYLCTTTDYRNVKAKYEHVIKKHFPFICWDRVIITSSKQMIKADILVDDGEHNLEGGDYLKILFTAPHNKNCNANKQGFIRADNWSEVYKIIRNYETHILCESLEDSGTKRDNKEGGTTERRRRQINLSFLFISIV